MRLKREKVFGVGINDSESTVSHVTNGKRYICKHYEVWQDMLRRCYSEKCQKKQPTYVGCSVDPEWHIFSNFRSWAETKNTKGMQLDKDIIFPGNKVYSPESCVFVTGALNKFLTNSARKRGQFLIGVSFCKRLNKFKSQCNDPFKSKLEYLGLFESETEAHEAWRSRKQQHAISYANMQTDRRVSEALKKMFLPKELMQ